MRYVVAICFTGIAVFSVSVLAQTPGTPSDLASNAALQYWQAFAQMPTLDKEQEKLLAEWWTAPFDERTRSLIAASQNSLMYLRRAAKLKRCDWGLDYNDGMSLLLPHLAKARTLAQLTALHARHEFEQGHWNAGREDAIAMMALARHVGGEPIMISNLVGYLIEDMTIDLVAPYVTDFKAPYRQAVATFESLPRRATLGRTISTEKEFMAKWMIRKLREAEKAGNWRELWKGMLDGSDKSDKARQIDSLDELVQRLEELMPVYDQLAGLVELPVGQFEHKYSAFKEEASDANPLTGLLLPAVDKVLAKKHRTEARMAMLLASIAVAEAGTEKLKDIRDPFGDGPFEYRRLDEGFELASKLQFEGAIVKLVVGQRKR
jgi:hypothetical protein